MEGKGQEQSFLSFLWSNMQFEKLDIHTTNKMYYSNQFKYATLQLN